MTTSSDPTPDSPGPANGIGVAALVLGIVAVVTAANGWWLFLLPVALATGVLAVVFGVQGRRRARSGQATNPGQALAGLVLGITSLGLVTAGGVAWAVWGDEWKDHEDDLDECIDDADDVDELRDCLAEFPDQAGEAGL